MTRQGPKIVLASQSPRRRELLAEAGYDFVVVPPREEAETPPAPGEDPREYVLRTARQKGLDVLNRAPPGVIVACDTVAVCRGEILGKPSDEADARRMLERLGGSEHEVLSGLCVIRCSAEPIVRLAPPVNCVKL